MIARGEDWQQYMPKTAANTWKETVSTRGYGSCITPMAASKTLRNSKQSEIRRQKSEQKEKCKEENGQKVYGSSLFIYFRKTL